jgi:uncharacterized membrane protein YgcG
MITPKLLNRIAVLGVISLLGAQSLPALSLILPMEAIYESGRLRQDEFKKNFPGIDVSSDIPDEEGYYVRYTHGNLTYYFGPVDDYYTAEEKSFELQEIIDLAAFELPYLKSSEIYVWQFSDGMFEDALSGGQQEGLQVAEIDGNPGSSGSSQSNEQGTIINTGPMNAAQMAQMKEAQENGELGQMAGFPGQMNQTGQQQMQESGGEMSQNQSNTDSNQENQSSQSQQSQSSSGSSGQGGGQGSGGGSSGSSKSQGQEQQEGGGMSIWKMLGRIFGM